MFLSSLSIFENRFLLSQNILESKSVAVPSLGLCPWLMVYSSVQMRSLLFNGQIILFWYSAGVCLHLSKFLNQQAVQVFTFCCY